MEELMLRNSERSTFRQCGQKWWWSYVEGLKPINTAPALRFGSLVHDALAEWYIPEKEGRKRVKRGPHPVETFERLYKEQVEIIGAMGMYTEPDGWTDAYDLGVDMLTAYVAEYGMDSRFRVVAPEEPFQIDIKGPDGEYLYTQVGTFDAIVEDTHSGQYGLLEHKTAASIRTDHLWCDEQAGTYYALAPIWLKHLGIDRDLDFILYNFLRKAKQDKRPQNEDGHYLNKDGSVSKTQPPPYFHREVVVRGQAERNKLLLRAKQELDEMQMIIRGELPVRKNFTRDCSWCDYQKVGGMCELHELGEDWESVRDAMYRTWNPYEDHDGQEEDDNAA